MLPVNLLHIILITLYTMNRVTVSYGQMYPSIGDTFPVFKILIAMPIDKATIFSRDLQEAIGWWEGMHRNIGRPNWNNVYAPSGDELNPGSLQFALIHVGNDTLRLFHSICDAIEKDTPSIILSLVDSKKTDYMRMIAESADVPLLTLSHNYMKEPQNIIRRITHNRQGILETRSMELSLDPPISSLADATFELLRTLNWFDAILVIDDSTASDLLSYRLTRLCRKGKRIYNNNHHGPIDLMTNAWRTDRYENRKQSWLSRTHGQEYRSRDSVWSRLKVIRLSKSLQQKEIYMKISEIQTSHRRIVLVHCDEITTKKVIETGKNLNLFDGQKVWLLMDGVIGSEITHPELYRQMSLPDGVLLMHQRSPTLTNTTNLFDIIKLFGEAAENIFLNTRMWLGETEFRNNSVPRVSCYLNATGARVKYSDVVYRELKKLLLPIQTVRYDNLKCKMTNAPVHHQMTMGKQYVWPFPVFDILNLVPSLTNMYGKEWKVIGNVTRFNATLDAIRFITKPATADRGHGHPAKHTFRVASSISPPFVQEAGKFENETCLVGTPCLKVRTNIPEELVVIFTDFNSKKRFLEGKSYLVHCCTGISIDMLISMSRDLNFDFDLYLTADGSYGINRNGRWDGATADLINGAAHLVIGAYSVTSERLEVIDFSTPYYFSGVSTLAHTHKFPDWSLFTFIEPFSAPLWGAIFLALTVTALFIAIVEWLSPIGMNPRYLDHPRIYSLGSSFWTCCSLLFRHYTAFKTPQSSTNKLLIHAWGLFCLVFWCAYLAQIASFYTSYLPPHQVNDFSDGYLMPMKTGVVRSSSVETYLRTENVMLWHHIENYKVATIEEGIDKINKGKLDLLIADTAVLEYYRAVSTDCSLRILGQPIFDDTYAIGMPKEFALREALSDLLMEYANYGYVDTLKKKWFVDAECNRRTRKPTPLSFLSVSGLYIFLIAGLIIAICVNCFERMIFTSLPGKRKIETTCWRTNTGMFFSQKIYRYVNGVDSNYSLRDGDSTDSESKELTKAMKTDTKERRSSF